MKTKCNKGAKYFVTFIDDFSMTIWIYPIKAKSECFDKFKEFKEFKALVENRVVRTRTCASQRPRT